MQITYWDRTDPSWWERLGLDPAALERLGVLEGGDEPAVTDGDSTSISAEAVRLFEQSALKPLVGEALSLKSIERRIAVVQAEIAEVWNSALPDDEKNRLVSCKENEIALLRAGQFAFAKAGFYRAA